jgi:DNA-binding response OmpR family regulator
MQVLVVDDESDILSTIIDQLTINSMVADCAQSGKQAISLVSKNHYDVIVLDVMMPGIDGLETCRLLRADGCTTPIIFLTARDTVPDKIVGFKAGADDYLVKPFAMDELLCRVQALGNRVSRQALSQLSYADLHIDLESYQVKRENTSLQLNQIQYKLLRCLMTQAPKVVTREQLELAVWQGESPDSDVLRSHLYQLRQIIDKPFAFQMLETVRGQGYRLRNLCDNH